MFFKVFLKKISAFVLDILFPVECINCGEEGKWICKNCAMLIKLTPQDHCPICAREEKTSRICFDCRNKTYLSGLVVGVPYRDNLVKKAIHLFKYRFLRDLSGFLSEILIKQFAGFADRNNFMVIPVPLHKKRLRWRGFNQSELLALAIAKHYNLEIDTNALSRLKNTIPQVEVADRRKRIDNIKNAFVIIKPESVKDKKIMLIDDVATTMATLDECARVLRLAGAKEVWAAVIARG